MNTSPSTPLDSRDGKGGASDSLSETASVGGKQVVKLSLEAYLRHIFNEVEENLEYITEIEGIDIPQVWQDKILDPIAFAIAVIQADDAGNDLELKDPEATDE